MVTVATTLKGMKLDDRWWCFGYDLPAESRVGCDEDTKTFLNTRRKDIWQQLRTTFDAVPLQMSLWILRDPQKPVLAPDGKMTPTLDAMKLYIAEWRQEYAKKGFRDVNMEMFPFGTDSQGAVYVSNSELRFLFEQMYSIKKMIDDAIQAKKCRMRRFNDLEDRREWTKSVFVQDFGTRHTRYSEFEQLYMTVRDKMSMDLQKVVTV